MDNLYLKNRYGSNEKTLKEKIMNAMHNLDDETLLSFGLLFTIIWKDSNPIERKQLIKYIKNNI